MRRGRGMLIDIFLPKIGSDGGKSGIEIVQRGKCFQRSSYPRRRVSIAAQHWIPAFAGMTNMAKNI